MNIHALFDKIAVDLESSGAQVTRDDDGASVLAYDGRDFARLVGERMRFRLPSDSPAAQDAAALRSSTVTDDEWVEVDSTDVSEWPRLAEQALIGIRS